jgi:hypothetical protein
VTASIDAWQEFLASLDRIGREVIAEGAADDGRDLADGLLVLVKSLWQGIELSIETTDPLRPRFVRVDHGTRKVGGACPDTEYETATIDPRHTYRITGTRGTNCYIGFCVYGFDDARRSRIVSNISDRDLTLDDDGHFEVVLSAQRPDELGKASWLELSRDAHTIVIRQYFLDRSTDVAPAYDIEVVDAAPGLERTTDAELETLLKLIARSCEFNATIGFRFLTDLRDMPNEFVPADTGRLMPFGPTPDNWYALAWYHLADDEALVIEGDAPDAQYWGFHLHDRWMDNFDYPYRQTGINCREVPLDAHGRYRVVIGPTASDEPARLDRGGRHEGHLFFRAQRPEHVSLPTCRVVPVSDVR